MLNPNELNLYRTLGKIHSLVSTAVTFDEAIRGESRVIVESGIADHVVVWCVNPEKGGGCSKSAGSNQACGICVVQ